MIERTAADIFKNMIVAHGRTGLSKLLEECLRRLQVAQRGYARLHGEPTVAGKLREELAVAPQQQREDRLQAVQFLKIVADADPRRRKQSNPGLLFHVNF